MPESATPQIWDNGTAPHASLAEALAAFQAEVPKMSKDETAKVKGESKHGGEVSYTYGYAGLDQFVEIVEPVLGKHGLSITSAPDFDANGRYILTVTLLHESGEERSGKWPLPDPNRYGPQDIGSSQTYGRRYLSWGLTGTFPGGQDDDGRQAQQSARESWDSAKPRTAMTVQVPDRPVSAPPAPVKKEWTDAEVGDQHEKLESLELDKAIKLYDWMAGKGLHGREVMKDGGFQYTATDKLATRLSDEALSPTANVNLVMILRQVAEARGLLKVQVSESETLDQVLHDAHELAAHAAVEQAKTDQRDAYDGPE